jgi:hypothetical protein
LLPELKSRNDENYVSYSNCYNCIIPGGNNCPSVTRFRKKPVRGTSGNDPWDEPLIKIADSSGKLNIPLIMPMIGEPVRLKDNAQEFREWWKNIE